MKNNKKGYLLFIGDHYYPSGGVEDFRVKVNSIDEALEYIAKDIMKEYESDLKWISDAKLDNFFDSSIDNSWFNLLNLDDYTAIYESDIENYEQKLKNLLNL